MGHTPAVSFALTISAKSVSSLSVSFLRLKSTLLRKSMKTTTPIDTTITGTPP